MIFSRNLIILFLLTFTLLGTAQTTMKNSNVDTLDSYNKMLAKAIQKGDPKEKAYILRDLAWLQSQMGMFAEAIDHAQQAIDLFEQLNNPREALSAYYSLVQVHLLMNDSEKAEKYIDKSLRVARELRDTLIVIHLLDARAQTLNKQKKFEAAINNITEALDLARKRGEVSSFLLNTLGSITLNKGDFQQGLKLALQVQTTAIAESDTMVLVYGVGNEAYAHAKLGNFEASEAAFKRLEMLLQLVPEDLNLQRALPHMKALVAEMRGDFKTAYYQMSLFHTLDSTASAEERTTQYANMEIAYQTQKKEQENERLNDKVFKQKLIFATIGIILSLGLILLFVQRQKLKISNQFLAISQQLTKEKLARTKQELADFTQSLHEKVSMIEQLKSDLAAQQNSVEKDNLLEQMSQAVILTTAQWAAFRMKFERVYPNFFTQLYQHVPQATEADLRFAALTKLNLSDVEIATILGISSDSVVKTRYRLRKKVIGNDVIELIRQFA